MPSRTCASEVKGIDTFYTSKMGLCPLGVHWGLTLGIPKLLHRLGVYLGETPLGWAHQRWAFRREWRVGRSKTIFVWPRWRPASTSRSHHLGEEERCGAWIAGGLRLRSKKRRTEVLQIVAPGGRRAHGRAQLARLVVATTRPPCVALTSASL